MQGKIYIQAPQPFLESDRDFPVNKERAEKYE
jgi:hypothetical protein